MFCPNCGFEHGELNGMGTTPMALLIKDEQTFLSRMRDNRAYLPRDSYITQLTTDHSMVNRMVK